MLVFNQPKHLLFWGSLTIGLSILAIGTRVWFEPEGTETLPGGSQIGLAFGLVGGALILFAWLLGALRFVPSWWFIGSRALWLKGHIWLSLVSFVAIVCHSGGRVGGIYEQILYLVFLLVILTGIFGLVLQQFLPRWLTIEAPGEVPYEQIPNVCAALRAKADLEIDNKCVAPVPATCERIKQWYGDVVRPFLGWPSQGQLLGDPAKRGQVFAQMRALPGVDDAGSKLTDLLDRLEEYCTDRRRLARQETLHHLLHGWLYLHVPLSAALLVMMIVHAVVTLYY